MSIHFIFIGFFISLLDEKMSHLQDWLAPFKYQCSSNVLLVPDFGPLKLPKN